jgi:ubiquinone/menaquinone biosynthesis C-methylase UbiE
MEPRSNIEWRRWAQYDPLYGIATRSERSRNGANPWTLPQFYEYGATNWSEYYPHWLQYGVNLDSCLEIGCGAGRITRQLVQCFTLVHGVDIAPEMLALAKDNVPGASFSLSDGRTIPIPEASVTAVFCCEVFQHLDSREFALSYFREIYRVLRSRGTCMIQLPICVLPLHRILPAMGTVQRILWQGTERWVRIKSNVKRWLIFHRNRRPFIYMTQYEPEWLASNLSQMGFCDIEIRIFPITGNPGEKYMDSYLLARKP